MNSYIKKSSIYGYKIDNKLNKFFISKLVSKKKEINYILNLVFIRFNARFMNLFLFREDILEKFNNNFKFFSFFLENFFSFDFFLFFDLKFSSLIFSKFRLNFFLSYFSLKFKIIKNLSIDNFFFIFCKCNMITSYVNNSILKLFCIFSFLKGDKLFKISNFITFFFSFKYFFKFIFDISKKDKNVDNFLVFFDKLRSLYKFNIKKKVKNYKKKYNKILNKFNNLFFLKNPLFYYYSRGYQKNVIKFRYKKKNFSQFFYI